MPGKKMLAASFGLGALALLPLWVSNPYVLHLLIMSMLWILLGQSWNLLGGYTGQVSFGLSRMFLTRSINAMTNLLQRRVGSPARR